MNISYTTEPLTYRSYLYQLKAIIYSYNLIKFGVYN